MTRAKLLAEMWELANTMFNLMEDARPGGGFEDDEATKEAEKAESAARTALLEKDLHETKEYFKGTFAEMRGTCITPETSAELKRANKALELACEGLALETCTRTCLAHIDNNCEGGVGTCKKFFEETKRIRRVFLKRAGEVKR